MPAKLVTYQHPNPLENAMNGTPTQQVKPCSIVGKICPECPFSRAVKPGALGGSPVQKYIGQILAPFLLPCHLHCDFEDPEWKDLDRLISTPQCLGAATMRANMEIDFLMPPQLLRAPVDHHTVFSNPDEFILHHTRSTSINLDLRSAAMAELLDPKAKAKNLG